MLLEPRPLVIRRDRYLLVFLILRLLCRSEPPLLSRDKSEHFIAPCKGALFMFLGQIPYRPSPPLATPRFTYLPERRGCLPCPAQLWRPRFSAGRGTYSPYRRPAPHPPWRIRLSAPGGNQTASIPVWMTLWGCPPDGFLLFLLYPFQSPLSALTERRGCPPCLVGLWLVGEMLPWGNSYDNSHNLILQNVFYISS